MDFFLARQPIFTSNKRVFAYELLYRGSVDTPLSMVGGDRATTSLLSSALVTEGIEKISNHKPCFINFTRELLLKQIPLSFSPQQIVVEVLEDVPVDDEVLAFCRMLKKQGYTIALDDFVFDRTLLPLIELSDIIKFDFRLSSHAEIQRSIELLQQYNLKFLAEKVETVEEFEHAAALGCEYFQGFFFCKPQQLKVKELTAVKMSLMRMLAELSKDDWSVKQLSQVITQDVALTYKLLRYLNSSFFSRLSKIENVEQGIAYLGEKEVRRFAMLAIISDLATEKPSELISQAMIRARFCELLAEHSSQKKHSRDMFILGLFSSLDAMLDMSMSDILEKLPIGDALRDGLGRKVGPYGPYLQAILAYERGDRQGHGEAIKRVGSVDGQIHKFYLQAIDFAQNFNVI